MDVNEERVLESLGQLFGVGEDGSRAGPRHQQQTVFWCDPDAQFAALIPRLSLGAGIEVVDLDQTPALAVKRRLQSHPEIHFLFYSAAAEPAPAQDWLLDVRLRSKSFRADLTSLLIEDLGLTSLSLAPYIRSRAKFLASESRRSKLKRLVEPGDDQSALDRKMLAVLLRSDESDGISLALRLLHTLWVPGQATVGTSSKAWTEVVNNGLDRAFWGLMHLGLGYNSDQPSLDELLRQLLVTDFARSVRRPPPEALRHLVLDNRVVAGNASILVTRWRSDVNLHASFADLSAAVADELRLKALIDHWSAEDLVDCLSFAPAERRIIQDLKGRVGQQGAAALADIQSIAARRRDGHWANTRISPVTDETLALAACYDALEAAAEFLALKERHAAGISFPDAAAGANAYIEELHRFDQYYRWFCHAANQVEPTGWGVLQELRTQIEGAYSGWFIPALSSAWTAVLEGPGGLLAHWRLAGLQSQQDFFDRRVASLLASGAAKRVFVLISDAFRYEAGAELVREINSKNRFTAELDAMLGVLPSYTALGMAALLPHQTLSYKPGSATEVLVDGQSTSTLEARSAQLQRFDGIAVRASDLLALGKIKGRERVADHRVIYVYHDLIDMTGDKQGSEDKTFEAVANTLKELNQILSFIINNLNRSLILVTADHGFLYQESALDQASKSVLSEQPAGTLRAKKRYLIGSDLPPNDKVWRGNTSVSAGTEVKEGSVDYWLPKGAMRFHTLVDGFTPYKDFPISLPQGAHELLMGMNAVAEGVYGVRRYSGDFNAFLNDLTLRTSDHAEAKMTHAQLELESDTTPNASEIFYNRFRNATAEYRLDLIEELMQRYSALLAIDFTSVASQLAEARKKIEQAHAPFQLGVAGEFRVGKSTLINALIGQEVAFTDFLEATPIRCQFRRAETPSATLHYIDGTSEEMEFDRANELISDRRDDDSWTDSVLKMEYRVHCDALADTDLWDAPGLGGRDVNDTRALEHLDRLGGIIWVVDATMIGKASVASPIVRMHAAGKPLICVLNRIDETEGDPEELCEWMRTAFPGVFMAIVPFSALEALSECAHGKLGAGSRRLWTAIISAMGDSSEKGRAVRVQRTAEQELKRIIGRLTPLRRHMQDRIGLIKHYESELYTSRESLLESVPGILREQTELAFSRLTSELFNAISQSRDQASHPIDRVLTLIGDRRTHSALTENVLRESISRISDNWRTLSGNSLKFSAAAIPVGSIGMPKLYSPEVIFNGGRLGQKAIDSGVYAGGLTAIITGTIAVVSTAITWPVILAALPVGALQAWKRQKEIGPSQADIYSELNRLVAMLKSAFLEQVVPVVRANISRALESEVRELVSVERRSVLGNAELESSRRFISDLQNLEEVSTGARAMVTDRWTANEVFRLMDDPGERLDIVVTDLAFSLAPLLRRLPSSTEVRLIFPSRGEPKSELEERVAKAFGTWAGKRSVRSVASLDTAKEIVLETMLLTSDYCLVSRQDLSDVLDDCGTFVELSEGRTVGQNRFASLWQGLPVHGSQIVVTPVL